MLWTAPVAGQQPAGVAVDTLSMWVVRGGDTTAVGRQIEQTPTRVVGGGSLVYRVILTDAMIFGPRVDTMMWLQDSGRPVRYVGATPRGIERLEVMEGRARGRVTGARGQVVELDLPVSDSTVLLGNIDLALRERLLPVGGIIPLKVLVPQLEEVVEVRMRVEGVEAIDDHMSWRVRAVNLQNNLTLWISQRDRTVRRQTVVGPNGVLLLFDRRPLPRPPMRRGMS